MFIDDEEDHSNKTASDVEVIEAEEESPIIQSGALQTTKAADISIQKIETYAENLAKTAWEIHSDGGKSEEIINVITGVISSFSDVKAEALVAVYCLFNKLSSYESSGTLCTSLLEAGLIEKAYKLHGSSVEDTYRIQTPPSAKNSKAYMVDAFVSTYYPMYSTGILGKNVSIAEELFYPNRFLNILFRAIKNSFDNDVKNLRNFFSVQSRIDSDKGFDTVSFEQSFNELEKQFDHETKLMIDLYSQTDSERVQRIVINKIDELLSGGREALKLGGHADSTDLSKKIDELPTLLQNMFSSSLKGFEELFLSLSEQSSPIISQDQINMFLKAIEEQFSSKFQSIPNSDEEALQKLFSDFKKFHLDTIRDFAENISLSVETNSEKLTLLIEKIDSLSVHTPDHGIASVVTEEATSADELDEELANYMKEMENLSETVADHPAEIEEEPAVVQPAISAEDVIDIINKAINPLSKQIEELSKAVFEVNENNNSNAKLLGSIHAMLSEEIARADQLINNMQAQN